MVPGITLGFNTTSIRRSACSTTTQLPRRVDGQLTDARAVYAHADRPRHRRHRPGGARSRAPTSTCCLGPRRREGGSTCTRRYAQDSWRMTPTLTLNAGLRWDLQTPFTRGQRHHVGGDAASRSAACPASATAARSTSATSSTPGATRGVVPRVRPADERHERLQDRLEQRRAERRRRVAAERAGRLPAHAPRRSGAGDAPRRLLGRYERQGLGVFTGRLRRATRAARSTLDAQRRQRQPRAGRRDLAGAAQPARTAVPRRRSRRRRRIPIAVRAEPRGQPQRLRADIVRSARRAPGRSASSASIIARHGGRHPLRRHARRRTSGRSSNYNDARHRVRTGSSTSSSSR